MNAKRIFAIILSIVLLMFTSGCGFAGQAKIQTAENSESQQITESAASSDTHEEQPAVLSAK